MGKRSSVLSAPSGLGRYSSIVTAVTEPRLSKDGGLCSCPSWYEVLAAQKGLTE